MRKQDKDEKRRGKVKREIDSKTRRAYLIARLNGDQKNTKMNEYIIPVKKKKPVAPVEIGFN